jgi:hypothetical protein
VINGDLLNESAETLYSLIIEWGQAGFEKAGLKKHEDFT